MTSHIWLLMKILVRGSEMSSQAGYLARCLASFFFVFHWFSLENIKQNKKRHDQSYLTVDENLCTRIRNELSSWLPGSLSGVIFHSFSLVFIVKGKIRQKTAWPVISDFWWKSLYEDQKKRSQQQTTNFWGSLFSLCLKDTMLLNDTKTNRFSYRTWSTWSNNNYL